jgi:Cu-Zn family superoxide dismutase
MKKIVLLLIVSVLWLSCQHSQLEIGLNPKSGSNAAGFALFSEKNGVVKLSVTVRGLSEGTHAIHLHEKADCSSDDGKSTGGHWNPTFASHGAWGNQEGYHKGDIGNFEVGTDGIGRVYFETNEWCIGCEDDTKNILGKAIIVHQGADDFMSQPSGAAGARISCAGIVE